MVSFALTGQKALEFARQSGDAQTQGQALMAIAQLRHETGDSAAADQLFEEALALLDTSHAHEVAATAYFRYANLLEERNEVQRSLNAIKKAYDHQRQGKRGESEEPTLIAKAGNLTVVMFIVAQHTKKSGQTSRLTIDEAGTARRFLRSVFTL